MVTVIRSDLEFILDQIKFSEAHAGGTAITSVNGGVLGLDPTLPYGVRTVDGRNNNVLPGQTEFGAADTLLPRIVPRDVATPPTGMIVDGSPRTISNLVVDQSSANPAAVAAHNALHPDDPPKTVQPRLLADGSANPLFEPILVVENVAPDVGLSAPFNSWMTLFGQFFDHGLDLTPKGGNSIVLVPLQSDDSLYNPLTPQTNFMVLTRATTFAGPGADGVVGTGDDTVEAMNATTSFVDQNQTYTSHSSHQVFLRAYEFDGAGKPVSTGGLLDGVNGGLPTWAEVKAQALSMLGITLTDNDVGRVPLILTDEYGRFIPDALTGFAQIVVGTNGDGTPILASGTPGAPVLASDALSTGHAFLDDIANHAAPGLVDHDNDPTTPRILKTADTDPGTTSDGDPTTFDNELLDAHFVTGDGRGNENIGLTAVHHIFHQEHNRVLEANKATILATAAGGDVTFLNEWLAVDVAAVPGDLSTLVWDGERMFQAARVTTEMQYQHLVFEEFARKVSPSVNVFAGYDASIDPSITAEFAHVVYRFGHSMLTETVDRLGPDGRPLQQLNANGDPVFEADGVTPVFEDMGLIQAFLNPLGYNATGEQAGGTGLSVADAAAGAVIRGMTRQVSNEIDEFVTDALRDNLLGLPLDLATLNIARAREQGVPTLNEARRAFYEGTANASATGNGDALLKPYESWAEFAGNIKNPLSVINFIAAYGTHISITSVDTIEAKRAAATLLVVGGNGAPSDRVDFLTAKGIYAPDGAGSNNDTRGGLENVDFWLGGLAERKMPFGGLLGSTFNFVFETQMERLQDGDRFYYLTRFAGQNFLAELENNSFTTLIERNTDLGADGMHLPGDIFSTPGHILEVDITKQIGADPTHELTGNIALDAIKALNPLVQRDNPATVGLDTNYLEYNGDQHVVLGGTSGNDILIASEGDDTLWGDAGNDRLEGGDGNDILNGGDGDDIIQDTFGDDNYKGGEGNDAIHTGAGFFDLVLAGGGNDFVVGAADIVETFGGRGNDFISGGPGTDTVFGNDGDDWIEGGDQADLLQGDNGAPFQDSAVVGNDVIIGQGGNDDYDSESGDDIMVAGPGVSRFEGMLGFDWVTYERDPQAANADMAFTGLLPPDLEANRDRFDLAEGISGGALNDVIRGDDADSAFLTNIDIPSGQNNALNNAAQIALIDGLQGLLGAGVSSFSGGNILLGGAGSDTIEGRGGDDIIDGDVMLNVRIAYTDINGVAGSADQMSEIQARVFAGEINPGNLSIVREIVDQSNVGDIDTAVFGGAIADYTVVTVDGVTTVTHAPGGVVGTDGTDTVRNIEVLQFADGRIILDPSITNTAATGLLAINGAVGADLALGVPLTVTIGDVADADNVGGVVALSAITVTWQAEQTPGAGDFIDIVDPDGFVVTGLSFTPTAAFGLDGLALRVRGTFTDAGGLLEAVVSAPTAPVSPPSQLLATTGDDVLVGTQAGETIDALAGNDSIQALGGDDTLIGGPGNDTLDGGDGNDTAVFNGPLSNFLFAINPAGELEVVDIGAGEEDVIFNIEQFVFDDVTMTLAEVMATLPGAATEGDDFITGTPGDDVINALGGNDFIDAGAGADDITGGLGADFIDAGTGDDTIFWAVGDGSDVIEAGADGAGVGGDRFRIQGSNADETFFVETVADYELRTGGFAAFGSEIVISRTEAGGVEEVIAFTTGLDDIDVNGGGGNDTFVVSGDFAATDLNPNTITLTGSGGNETVNLSGLRSGHRIVYNTNGGTDTVQGQLRPQDNVVVAEGTNAIDYEATDNNDGTTTNHHSSSGHSITYDNGDDATLHTGGNAAPVANADAFTAAGTGAVTFTAAQLLGNDTDADGQSLVIASVRNGTGGTVVLNGDGSVTFTPTPGFTGAATFKYKATDGIDRSGSATVTVNVEGAPNVAPTNVVLTGTSVNEFAAAGTLVGILTASDANGDTLTFEFGDGTTNSGAFQIVGNQLVVANGVAIDFEQASTMALTIRARDTSGAVSTAAAVVLTVNDINPENVIGTGNGETIVGGALDDVLSGRDGADRLVGGGGKDTLIGGLGADQLIGEGGDDIIWFDSTDTELAGGAGFDHMIQTDNVAISRSIGGLGVEVFKSGGGNDAVDGTGSAESMIIYGGSGEDTLTLGAAGGYLMGEDGADTLNGSTGNDNLIGGAGADTLDGGLGNDVLYIDGADGNAFQGGDGADYAYVNTMDAVNVLLNGRGIEVFVSNAGDDIIDATGTNFSMSLYGGAGSDMITAGNGSTQLFGEAGNDTLNGGSAGDLLIGGVGVDVLNGGGGNDLLFIDADDVSATGGDGFDTLIVENGLGANIAFGVGAIEAAVGHAGADRLDGTGASVGIAFYGGGGNDTLTGGIGGDTFSWNAGDGTDTVIGGAGGLDRLVVSGAAGDETYFVETVADYVSRTGVLVGSLPAGTTVIVSRQVAGALASEVVSFGQGLDEVNINSVGGLDTFVVSDAFVGMQVDAHTLIVDVGASGGGGDAGIAASARSFVMFLDNDMGATPVDEAADEPVASDAAMEKTLDPFVLCDIDGDSVEFVDDMSGAGTGESKNASAPVVCTLEDATEGDTLVFDAAKLEGSVTACEFSPGDTIDLAPVTVALQLAETESDGLAGATFTAAGTIKPRDSNDWTAGDDDADAAANDTGGVDDDTVNDWAIRI